MQSSSLNTTHLHALIDRLRQGDQAARDELIRMVQGRLQRLAKRMLGDFPAVRRHTETLGLLDNCLLRMLNALQSVQPASTRDFFRLAAVQMRRELLNLAAQLSRRREVPWENPQGAESDVGLDVVDHRAVPVEHLEQWCRFHEEVAALPVEQVEVVCLIFYHGWTRIQIGELLGIDERTVRRRWHAALLHLTDTLGELPPL